MQIVLMLKGSFFFLLMGKMLGRLLMRGVLYWIGVIQSLCGGMHSTESHLIS